MPKNTKKLNKKYNNKRTKRRTMYLGGANIDNENENENDVYHDAKEELTVEESVTDAVKYRCESQKQAICSDLDTDLSTREKLGEYHPTCLKDLDSGKYIYDFENFMDYDPCEKRYDDKVTIKYNDDEISGVSINANEQAEWWKDVKGEGMQKQVVNKEDYVIIPDKDQTEYRNRNQDDCATLGSACKWENDKCTKIPPEENGCLHSEFDPLIITRDLMKNYVFDKKKSNQLLNDALGEMKKHEDIPEDDMSKIVKLTSKLQKGQKQIEDKLKKLTVFALPNNVIQKLYLFILKHVTNLLEKYIIPDFTDTEKWDYKTDTWKSWIWKKTKKYTASTWSGMWKLILWFLHNPMFMYIVIQILAQVKREYCIRNKITYGGIKIVEKPVGRRDSQLGLVVSKMHPDELAKTTETEQATPLTEEQKKQYTEQEYSEGMTYIKNNLLNIYNHLGSFDLGQCIKYYVDMSFGLLSWFNNPFLSWLPACFKIYLPLVIQGGIQQLGEAVIRQEQVKVIYNFFTIGCDDITKDIYFIEMGHTAAEYTKQSRRIAAMIYLELYKNDPRGMSTSEGWSQILRGNKIMNQDEVLAWKIIVDNHITEIGKLCTSQAECIKTIKDDVDKFTGPPEAPTDALKEYQKQTGWYWKTEVSPKEKEEILIKQFNKLSEGFSNFLNSNNAFLYRVYLDYKINFTPKLSTMGTLLHPFGKALDISGHPLEA